jgi:hypothetical protein
VHPWGCNVDQTAAKARLFLIGWVPFPGFLIFWPTLYTTTIYPFCSERVPGLIYDGPHKRVGIRIHTEIELLRTILRTLLSV